MISIRLDAPDSRRIMDVEVAVRGRYDSRGLPLTRGVMIMTLRQSLQKVLEELPEDRLHEVLDFARFLAAQRDREQWVEAARQHFAGAYGPDEPEYTLSDVKAETNR